ncbi:alpha/beta hydrolase family protein [Peribacillus alkalitolerans]|uniref:S9 family peptidase n=1 Tax=Peribacillus alkalitolerans TaxID=1550385 RepID=UPI0013D4EC88|nr:S9 family peptidase [Peribacillus alkalitolerans]
MKKTIIAEDLLKMKSVTDPQFSPDGEKLAFVQTEMDKEDNKYVSNIHILFMKSGEIVSWTQGKNRNTSPRWSPDGKTLAFLSNRSGKNQIYVMSTSGGEAKQVTEFTKGASSIVWSPCSNLLLSSTSLKVDESFDEKEKEEKKPQVDHYKALRYKSDASGYMNDSYSQLVLINVLTDEFERFTNDEFHYTPSSFSPDGAHIAFTASLEEEPDFNLHYHVYVMDLQSKESQKIVESQGYYSQAIWSPDGKYIAYLGHGLQYFNATISKLWVFHVETSSTTCLTGDLDLSIGDFTIGDFQIGASAPGYLWSNDGLGLYFLATEKGSTNLHYTDLASNITPIFSDGRHIYGYSIHEETQKAIFCISSSTEPGDLYSFDLENKELNQATNANKEILQNKLISSADEFTFTTSDGLTIQGWMIKPAEFEEGKTYPVVLEIHGGPHAMYGNTYYHEFQTLAGQGFVVIYTNPRGSLGYGQEFVNAVRGDYGGNDFKDLMQAIDTAIERYSFIDKEKQFVTGGSYGGFMTNWIVGHTNRFKAAVSQRCISNWISFYGVSDIGYYFTEWQIDGTIFDDVEKLWDHSPLKYAKDVQTPLLLLHGEKDYRCPLEQAEQFFVALKRLKKEVELVTFPNENHEVSRSGKPWMKIAHVEHIKNWFVKHLD